MVFGVSFLAVLEEFFSIGFFSVLEIAASVFFGII